MSEVLKVCLDCIRKRPKETFPFIKKAHQKVRERYNLPAFLPKTKGGIKCNLCQNQCQMGEGEKGYCGLRESKDGKLKSKVSPNLGLLYSYFDPIPTNCCASWFCTASREALGKNNLAVFFYGCSFDCLFCQNWSHKLIGKAPRIKVEDLLKIALDPSVYCICFFGGSPEPQLPFAINFSKKILKIKKIRICFEWNGSSNENLVKKVAEISLRSGGLSNLTSKLLMRI